MTPIEVAVRLVELLLDLLPHQEIRVLLDDAARKRIDTAVDLAEEAKFRDG